MSSQDKSTAKPASLQNRLKTSTTPDAGDSRASRETADEARTGTDGTILSLEERMNMLRNELGGEVLPTPPKSPDWHYCWLSTTNTGDPIYRRMKIGYEPVKVTELPGYEVQHQINGGQFDGCIACNEMILFKIPIGIYEAIMMINHHEKPLEEEKMISDAAKKDDDRDSKGKPLVSVEGFDRLGKQPVPIPNFLEN